MKKTFVLTLILSFTLILFPIKTKATNKNENVLSLNSPTGILMEYSTGKILYAKNEKQRMYPASMTKMMSMYLLLECVENKTHSFSDIVTVSSLASSMGGSQIFLKENEKMSFKDLFTAIAVASANDAVVALAEYTYGSIENFINEMNNKAKLFSMNETNFVNTTGFHDENHYTTPQDMAILARKLLSDYGDTLLEYTSIYETYLRTDSEKPFWLVTTNKLLSSYDGMDGLKTGFTSQSGYNLTATALRDNLRLICVVMGGETSKSRNSDITKLLNYGFNNYKTMTIFNSEETIKEVKFVNAKNDLIPVVSKEDINIVIEKNKKADNILISIEIFDNSAPKNKDEIIGKIYIKDKSNNTLAEYDLYPKEDVLQLTFIDILFNYLKCLF